MHCFAQRILHRAKALKRALKIRSYLIKIMLRNKGPGASSLTRAAIIIHNSEQIRFMVKIQNV